MDSLRHCQNTERRPSHSPSRLSGARLRARPRCRDPATSASTDRAPRRRRDTSRRGPGRLLQRSADGASSSLRRSARLRARYRARRETPPIIGRCCAGDTPPAAAPPPAPRRRVDQLPGFLVHRQRDHALRPELDPLRDRERPRPVPLTRCCRSRTLRPPASCVRAIAVSRIVRVSEIARGRCPS